MLMNDRFTSTRVPGTGVASVVKEGYRREGEEGAIGKYCRRVVDGWGRS